MPDLWQGERYEVGLCKVTNLNQISWPIQELLSFSETKFDGCGSKGPLQIKMLGVSVAMGAVA